MKRVSIAIVILLVCGGVAFGQMGRGPVGPTIPSMSGNSGKVLTNNGSVASWGTVSSVTAPGSTTHVLFNDAGATAGDGNFTYDKTTDTLTTKWMSIIAGATVRTIASATTVDLGNATTEYVEVSGTTGITAFSAARARTVKFVRFTGALTITYNATSLILPGARNITTEAGDRATFISLGGGNWLCQEFLKINGKGLGDVAITTHSGSENVTAVSMYGNWHNITGAYTATLPAAVVGMSGTFNATTAAVFSVDCQAADHFVLAGTSLTNGNKITSDGYAGSQVEVVCTEANTWRIRHVAGIMVDGGA